MKKFKAVTSKIIPLPIKDVDTDMIIPAEYLTSTARSGYGDYVFKRLREQDAAFPFNKPEYRAAKIVVAESNFGCGSSREHAVWALQGWGIDVVISKSFADIFSSNSLKNGLVLITLPAPFVDRLLKESAAAEVQVSVSLAEQKVELPWGESISFEFDPFRKHCIMEGLEDIDYLLAKQEQIRQFRQLQQSTTFFSTLPSNVSTTSNR